MVLMETRSLLGAMVSAGVSGSGVARRGGGVVAGGGAGVAGISGVGGWVCSTLVGVLGGGWCRGVGWIGRGR